MKKMSMPSKSEDKLVRTEFTREASVTFMLWKASRDRKLHCNISQCSFDCST